MKARISFEERLAEAERTVAALDDVDGVKDRRLRTIVEALECGLRNPGSNAAFDALVMLRDVEAQREQGGKSV